MERKQYQESLKHHRDLVNSLDYAEKKGVKEGIEIGVEKTQLATIKNCIDKNLPLELISEITNISINNLKQIIAEQGWELP